MPRKWKDFNWKICYGQDNTETRSEKNNISNGMCVVCENGKDNLEHLLIDCRHVYGIWDAVERLIKSCISNSFPIGHFIILAGHFQQSVESKMAKMILSITRWMLWKCRNNKTCEGNDMNEIAKYMMLFKELKLHILLLQKSAKKFWWCTPLYQFQLKWLCLQMMTLLLVWVSWLWISDCIPQYSVGWDCLAVFERQVFWC